MSGVAAADDWLDDDHKKMKQDFDPNGIDIALISSTT